ncbi:hypothetical protein FRC09_013989 [Ceratobasidium sp. 395]|nr:hypothetical protein FRC09_013989 [Ceratobasidium sp. 395]
MNSAAVADMISGNLMPQKPEILASTVSITFIGRGKIRDPSTLNMLRVRRNALSNALAWLKENNKKYYGDIVIDKARLNALPFDGVPEAIQTGIRHETNESMVGDEYNGYVPETYHDENADVEAVVPVGSDAIEVDEDHPDVIPLQYLGVTDSDLSKVSSEEMTEWGLHNMQRHAEDSSHEPGYAVRHGAPVNTFGQPPRGQGPADPNRYNLWEAAHIALYPYGVGGLESDRPVQISFDDHARWSLQYHDPRFRYHHSFIFSVFGEQQKRQGLISSKIQMNRYDFDKTAHILSTITPSDRRHAAAEETRGEKPSNEAVQVLKRNITAVSRKVMASGASRTQLRSQIYSAAIYFNQPTVWLTINPDDLHDPIAQIFAGEEIDMDNFIKTAGPDGVRRSQNIARDPYAAATFFHFTITLVLEKLFGIKALRTHVDAQNGVLGKVKAYFGTVECQGRGTLHLHMLLWLHNVPSPRRLKEMLRTSEFRSKVAAFLGANVRSFRPGLANREEVKRMLPQADVAYSRTPNPALPFEDFIAQLDQLETSVVCAKQFHQCEFNKCLRRDKVGRITCKRGAPWELSNQDSVDEDGTYHTKRINKLINGYCPAIAHTLKCNQDIQLLLHGNETLHIAHYISKYMTKAEGRTHNIASLLADNLTNHYSEDPTKSDFLRRQQLLIYRAINILNREQEISAPLAVLHIMKYPDVYRSHHFETIFWGSFVSFIYRSFEGLKSETSAGSLDQQDCNNRETLLGHVASETGMPNQLEGEGQPRDNNTSETVRLEFNDRGSLYRRSQIDDYVFRGELASSYNVLDYFVNTYERLTNQGYQDSLTSQLLNEFPDSPQEDDPVPQSSVSGRQPHKRVKYLASHPRSRTHTRVIRPATHNHAPNILGPRFPRRSDPTQAHIYAACILTFLKPWRSPHDIKRPDQTWSQALSEFLATASERIHDIIDNLEHKNESQAAAETKQQISPELEDELYEGPDAMELDDPITGIQSNGVRYLASHQITQEMLDKASFEMENYREVVHGVHAVRIGQHKGVFGAQQMPVRACDERASRSDMKTLKSWLSLMKQDSGGDSTSHSSTDMQLRDRNDIGTVEPLALAYEAGYDTDDSQMLSPTPNCPHGPPLITELLTDQQRAFGIFKWHLTQTLRAQDCHDPSQQPPQLRMLLVGEGGTGKSRVIQVITQEFKRLGIEDRLIKAAFAGCAASHIEGQTAHSIARILVGKKNSTLSAASKQEMARVWKPVEYLIIDEYSMLSKEFFAQLSRHIAIAKLGRDPQVGDLPFGGVNILLCGDGHQIPPVAVSAGGALYHPATSEKFVTSPEAGIGRKIYESFNTVVILKQQVRVTDAVWQKFLSNFRVAQVDSSDIALLDSVTLTNPKCIQTDFSQEEWKDCVLITPRNAVRMRWNDKSVEEHCRRTGEQLLTVKALDTCKDNDTRRPIDRCEQYFAMKSGGNSQNSRKGRRERGGLPDEVQIAIGMKVMVTQNLNTDIDITNGARGEIVGIMLDPLEPTFSPTQPQVTLTQLPSYILVKLDRTRASTLPGLEAGVIPVVPSTRNYSISIPFVQSDGQICSVTRSVKRVQFPISPAYAFTDYRAQGQTLKKAIIDIAEPPTGGKLSQPNVYVALSRCSGLNSIRILRDFDRSILRRPINLDLIQDDERLERLNATTKAWWDHLNT